MTQCGLLETEAVTIFIWSQTGSLEWWVVGTGELLFLTPAIFQGHLPTLDILANGLESLGCQCQVQDAGAELETSPGEGVALH